MSVLETSGRNFFRHQCHFAVGELAVTDFSMSHSLTPRWIITKRDLVTKRDGIGDKHTMLYQNSEISILPPVRVPGVGDTPVWSTSVDTPIEKDRWNDNRENSEIKTEENQIHLTIPQSWWHDLLQHHLTRGGKRRWRNLQNLRTPGTQPWRKGVL